MKVITECINAFILLTSVFAFGKIVLKNSSKINKKKNIALFITICLIQALTFIYFDGTLKTLIILLSNTLFYKYIFKLSLLKSIFITFLYMVLIMIPEILELLVITNMLGVDLVYNNYAGSIIANLITISLLIIITIILKKPLRKIVNAEISDNIKMILLSIITLIAVLLFFYSLVKKYKLSNDILQYLFAIVVLVSILFSLIKQTIDNNELTKEYDKLLEFMTTYENEIENQRILRHETKNEFLTIRAKICDKQENNEIVNYIDEILKDKMNVKYEQYAKFGYLPPNGIKGLCYFKVQEAETKGIKVALNISSKLKNSNIYHLNTKEQRELGRILGVILDNAIEASENSEKKQIGIEAYTNKDKEFKIIISNTYNNELDNEKIGKEIFSTKGKNRGHGLLLVKHIINENKIFELTTNIQNDVYTQIIKVKKV